MPDQPAAGPHAQKEASGGVLFERLLHRHSKAVPPQARPMELVARQRLKMSRSPQAFVRGTTAHFYRWLEAEPGPHIPQGPSVWICGDCHYGNFGPVGSASGDVEIALRDFDQAVIGNPAHDLIRLALSLAITIRDSALSGVTIVDMMEQMTRAYENALLLGDERESLPICVRRSLRAAYRRNWKKLAGERADGLKWYLPRGKRFWELGADERTAVEALLNDGEFLRTVLAVPGADKTKLEDAAYWVKGCSSLGLLRLAVLLRVKGKSASCWRLIDIKEAIESKAPRAASIRLDEDSAPRVVAAAKVLSPGLGSRMIARTFLGKSIFAREVLPQDLKLEITALTPQEAIKAARYLAALLGRAHAVQMSQDDRREWAHELERGRSAEANTSNWLRQYLVALMTIYQAAYLEHCQEVASSR